MKRSIVENKIALYIVGVLTACVAVALIVLVGLSELGLLHPRLTKLAIQTESVTRMFDGTPLAGENYTVTYGSLLNGHELRAIPQSSQTYVGSCENEMDFSVVDRTGADVTELYDIEASFGTLTVEPQKLHIQTGAATKRYDGEPLSSDSWSIIGSFELAKGHTFELKFQASITEVGQVENQAVIVVKDKNGDICTDQYELVAKTGVLKITPRNLVIQTDSAEKIYDGTPLLADGYQISSGSLLSGHRIEVSLPTQITAVGKVPNAPELTVYDRDDKDVTNQYNIAQKNGTLEVKGYPIYVKTASSECVYDGNPISNGEWSIQSGALLPGHKMIAIGAPELSTVGTLENRLSFKVEDSLGKDVTTQYDIIQIAGTLTVTARNLTIQTKSNSKVYDGKELSGDGWSIVDGSLCAGHTASVVCSSRTLVGSSENSVVSCKIYAKNANGRLIDVTECYKITYKYGTLTVKSPS